MTAPFVQSETYIPRTADAPSTPAGPDSSAARPATRSGEFGVAAAGVSAPNTGAPLPSVTSRLHLSVTDRWLAGVCGGVAETYGLNPGLVRLAFVLSIVLPGPQVIFYLLAWMIMPRG